MELVSDCRWEKLNIGDEFLLLLYQGIEGMTHMNYGKREVIKKPDSIDEHWHFLDDESKLDKYWTTTKLSEMNYGFMLIKDLKE